MNIHIYKKKSKSITRMINAEITKPENKQCLEKIRRLRTSKKNITSKIKEMKTDAASRKKKRRKSKNRQ